MSLLIGTRDGVYRSSNGTLDDVEKVLDSGDTLRVRTFERHGTFATTRTGLYRSDDDGTTWERLSVPREEVDSVVVSPDSSRLYAGTYPAHLYVSTDRGETWHELTGFRNLPSRKQWNTPRHGDEAHVRSLGVHPDVPSRLIAGVEVGGVHVSDDDGETWSERRDGFRSERRDGLHYDVHHVLVLEADEYVVSAGGGLYRTRDAGRSWTRLGVDSEKSYFHEAVVRRGRLYASGETLPPGPWTGGESVDAGLFESEDCGDTFEAVPYPGGPDEAVFAWTATDDRVLAGTNTGRVIVREDDGWITLGSVPMWIRSLTAN